LNDFPAGISARFLESSRLPPMRIRSALLIVPAVLVLVAAACNGEGEGQPCDHLASGNPGGSDDCQSGLICVIPPNPSTNGYRCCPSDLSKATTFECTVANVGIDASPLPPDAASSADGPAPGEDAPVEGSADAAATPDASEGGAPADAAGRAD
jgi:hypothetical protein